MQEGTCFSRQFLKRLERSLPVALWNQDVVVVGPCQHIRTDSVPSQPARYGSSKPHRLEARVNIESDAAILQSSIDPKMLGFPHRHDCREPLWLLNRGKQTFWRRVRPALECGNHVAVHEEHWRQSP